MAEQVQLKIPVLTEIIERSRLGASQSETELLIAELQTQIASSAFTLTEELLRSALAEMEAAVYERMIARLRRELPEIIDSVLREQLAGDGDQDA